MPSSRPPLRLKIEAVRATSDGGLEALVITSVAAFCLALATGVSILDSQTGGRLSWAVGVIVLCSIVFVPVSVSGLFHSITKWRTRLGKVALGLNLGMILFILLLFLLRRSGFGG